MTTATHTRPDAPVFLIGFMASGKTTVGRIVAAGLNWRFADLDQMITEAAGRSVAQIFADEGEAGFRRRETDALMAASTWRRTVLATGGGAACVEANLALMLASGRVVALSITPDEVGRRAGTDSGRPLLATTAAAASSDAARADVIAKASALLEVRAPFYARAHHLIDTVGKSPEAVAAEVLRLLDAEPA